MSLTPEQIERCRRLLLQEWCVNADAEVGDKAFVNAFCDLAIKGLSAARKDKALRELVRLKDLRQKIVDNTDKILDTPTGVQDYAFAVRAHAVAEAIAWKEARAAVEEAGQTDKSVSVVIGDA